MVPFTKKDVGPSVIVIIKDGHAGAGGFDNVFFRRDSAENVAERQARFFGDINEIDGWLALVPQGAKIEPGVEILGE